MSVVQDTYDHVRHIYDLYIDIKAFARYLYHKNYLRKKLQIWGKLGLARSKILDVEGTQQIEI